MRQYCTLFDSKYLPQGLALYESLRKHSSEPFTLYVAPMDEETETVLLSLHLPHVVMIHGFNDLPAMLELRAKTTHQEYCWASASQLAEYLLEVTKEDINYIDADCFFFSDPKVIFDEIGERSIAVIPHRFIPAKKYLEVNGKFNVSLVHFKNDPIGRECLTTWAWQCREKCSAKDGCGDQKYLDAWPGKYGTDLCVIQNIGIGLAPWNLANYIMCLHRLDGPPGLIDDCEAFEMWPVIMYHYHEFKELPNGHFRLTNYDLRSEDIELIYEPYLIAYQEAKTRIESLNISA